MKLNRNDYTVEAAAGGGFYVAVYTIEARAARVAEVK